MAKLYRGGSHIVNARTTRLNNRIAERVRTGRQLTPYQKTQLRLQDEFEKNL